MRNGWDLGDLYRGDMSLRSFRVRVRSLEPDSPLHAALAEAEAKHVEDERFSAVDDALNRYRPKGVT